MLYTSSFREEKVLSLCAQFLESHWEKCLKPIIICSDEETVDRLKESGINAATFKDYVMGRLDFM